LHSQEPELDLNAFALHVTHPWIVFDEQVAQLKWQFTFTQFPSMSNCSPDTQLHVPSLFLTAFCLQVVQPLVFPSTQLSHLTLHLLQLPFKSMKYPLTQTQSLVESFRAFDLHSRQFVLAGPKHVAQVL
jgi:hypothetical protein